MKIRITILFEINNFTKYYALSILYHCGIIKNMQCSVNVNYILSGRLAPISKPAA